MNTSFSKKAYGEKNVAGWGDLQWAQSSELFDLIINWYKIAEFEPAT